MSPLQLSHTALFILCIGCLITIFGLIVKMSIKSKEEDISPDENISEGFTSIEINALNEPREGFFTRLEKINGNEREKQISTEENTVLQSDSAPVKVRSLDEDFVVVRKVDVTDINASWDPLDVVDNIGNFQIFSPTADTFKWRIKGIDGEVLLESKADYASERTCSNGVHSIIKIMELYKTILFEIVEGEKGLSYSLKAKNGKEIGVSPFIYETKEKVNTNVQMIYLLCKTEKGSKNTSSK